MSRISSPEFTLSPALLIAALLLPAACSAPGGAGSGGEEDVGHVGPAVDMGAGGPARYVPELFGAFDVDAAMETVAFGDGFHRAPAGDGYEAVLEHLRTELEAVGYGARSGFELESFVIDPAYPAWTPRAASVALVGEDGRRDVLHRFERSGDRDRLMLPVGAPSCDVSGEAVLRLRDVRPGTILVTHSPPRIDVLRRAHRAGAVAVLSSSLASYNVLPGTMDPLPDALRLRIYPRDGELPLGMISRDAHDRIEAELMLNGSAQLAFRARADVTVRPLRGLAATVVGSSRPNEAVVLPSHIRYAGASDNASGFGASLENARLLAREIRAERLSRPERSMVFLYGPEIRQSQAWLEQTSLTPVASITAVACGDSAAAAGSPQLLERMPDPGALKTLPPDAHTQWGHGEVTEGDLRPNGLALITRCALADVAVQAGGWRTQDHPYEGGSDPDAFLAKGVPAVLLWHFSSSWYHTSLDRLEVLDPAEVERSGVAALATALCVASPEAGDLQRYLRSVDQEERVRVRSALAAGDEDLAGQWETWSDGARAWLAALCGS